MDEHTCIGFVFYDNIIREPLIIKLLRFESFRRTAVNLQAIRGLVFLRHRGALPSPVPKEVFPGAEPLAPRCRRNAPFKRRLEWGGDRMIYLPEFRHTPKNMQVYRFLIGI